MKTKRALSLILALALTLAILPFGVFNVSAATYNYLFPVNNGGRIAYPYGYSDAYGDVNGDGAYDWHDGIDIHNTGDKTIYAALGGVVTFVSNSCTHSGIQSKCEHFAYYGNCIKIAQDDGTEAHYGHLLYNSILVSVGTRVEQGQAIATMGTSGYSTGIHLHFQVMYKGSSVNVNYVSNGGNVVYKTTGYNPNPPDPIDYETISNGTYYIKNNANGEYVSVSYASDTQGQNVNTYGFNNTSEYQMVFTKTSGEGYKIRPAVCASRLINAYGVTVTSGLNVNIWNDVNESSQWWGLEKVSGGFVIRNMMNPSCVLTRTTTSTSNREIIVSTYTGDTSQIWTIQNYITYDANGGSGAPSGQLKNYDETLYLSSTKPTRSGYTFLGWSTSSSATSPSYYAGGSFTSNSNTTLYAVWEQTISLSYEKSSDGTHYIVSDYTGSATEVVIPSTYDGLPVEEIGNSAFSWCNSLTSITIPDSVTTIGAYAFIYCDSLTSITIPDSVTTIESLAFSGCSSLASINIPSSVTTIGIGVFYGCSALETIVVDSGNASYHSAGNCIIETAAKTLVVGCKNSVIPADGSVTTIGEDAFSSCSGLTSITIPDSVTTIGDAAFYRCDSLTSITIPDSVTTIGAEAFSYCYNLTSIIIPDSVTTIGSLAFSGCDNLAFNVYNNAKYLGNGSNPHHFLVEAVSKDITSCNIHSKTKVIVGHAFIYCDSLASITIPDSVTTIGDHAFSWCESLTSVTIGNSVTTIGESTFSDCDSLTSATIGNSVTTIGDFAFSDCENLTSITIPDSVTTIGEWAFYWCDNLTGIYCEAEEQPADWDDNWNYGCDAIVHWGYSGDPSGDPGDSEDEEYYDYEINPNETLNIEIVEDELTYIKFVPSVSGYYVFRSISDDDTYAYLYDSEMTQLDSNDDGENDYNFYLSYYFNAGETYYFGVKYYSGYSGSFDIVLSGPEDGFSYTLSDNGTYYIISDYDRMESDVVIPSEYNGLPVEEIGEYAFSCCYSLTSITIPDSVTTIGDSAFEGCESLTSITIPDSVTTIGWSAFSGCDNLTSITIPDSVTTIGDSAFEGCESLTSVTIPDSVTTIGHYAFSVCESLTSVTIPDSVTTIGGWAFYDCEQLTDIYCEADSKPAGWSDDWNEYCYATVHWGYGAEAEIILGDITGDDTITATDYIVAKRAVMSTYDLTEAQIKLGDVNGDGSVTAADYIMLKRHVMGTYVIGG